MKRVNILPMLLAGIMLFVINITTAGAQDAPPSQPSSFYGTVKVNGANVPDGTQLTALINGTQQASAATQTYQGESVYSIAVPNGNNGDTITFQVGGVDADQTGTWQLGASTVLNLTVSNAPAATPTAAATPVGPAPTPTGPAPSGLTAQFSCVGTENALVGEAPLTISCTDESTGNITEWSWDFGDGTTSTEPNPSHTYTTQGSYSVALTVTGADGSNTAIRTNYVYICQDDFNVCAPVISSGELSVEWTSVIFPPTSIAGFEVLANAITQTWTVSDTTNFGAGWHVTLIAEDHLRGEQDRDNRVINVGTTHDFKVSCLDSDVEPVVGASTAGNLPTCSIGAQPIPNSALAETPLTILSAAQSDGIGPYTFVPRFELIIPGTTLIDVYGTNIFVDAIAGP